MKKLSLLLMLCIAHLATSQNALPTIKAKSKVASIRIGDKLYKDAWEMTPNKSNDPEGLGLGELPPQGLLGAVITDLDSFGIILKPRDKKPLRIVLNEKDTVWAVLKGGAAKANFSETYKKQNEGKTIIEVPEVYELVNVIMAITPTGLRDSGLIEHDALHYPALLKQFSPFKNHRAVVVMDSLLKADAYFEIKMDAYSLVFEGNKLVKKSDFDRISWGDDNTILPYVGLIEDFAKKSKFLKFYQKNKPYYASMIAAFRDSLGVKQMQDWLNLNFPDSRYNCFKIIFSPLVSANQSATSFDNNGFKEGQAHVNFPNYWYNPKKSKLSEKGVNIRRGNIVFTELNHLFEDHVFENEQNLSELGAIKLNLSLFADKTKPAGTYSEPFRCVAEYMNWALVSLRFMDLAPKEDWEPFFKDIENNQTNNRGFIQFKAYNRFLIKAYQERKQGQTVTDLYPQIMQWFKEHNK